MNGSPLQLAQFAIDGVTDPIELREWAWGSRAYQDKPNLTQFIGPNG
jgi:hypothetical protein